MKLVSVVVTYNRKKDLLVNLQSQLSQSVKFDKIIIIDNASSDGTYEYLNENHIFENDSIDYHRLTENIGGAGGFEQGVRLAHNTDADAYVLMDDDGYMFTQDTLKILVEHIPNQSLYMLNSWLIFDAQNPVYSKTEEIYGFICPFNSTLISKQLVDKIGYPNGAFFIRGDEVDYFMRAKSEGAYISTICNSLYYHPLLSTEKRFLGIRFSIGYDSPWKEYYGTRNTTFRMRRTSKFRAWLSYRKRLIGLFLFGPKNKKEFRYFIKLGYKHGKRGVLGKTVMPGQSYDKFR